MNQCNRVAKPYTPPVGYVELMFVISVLSFSAFQMQRYLCPAAGCFGVHRQYAACSWSISLFPQEEHLKTSLRELTRDTDTNVKPNGSKVKDYGKLDVISSDSN
jgi:hypothetical protein